MTGTLDGIDLVVFDKDGTLIEFSAMWAGWARDVADRLRRATGLPIERRLFEMLGFDPATARVLPGGGLAATPMARLRDQTMHLCRALDVLPGRTAVVGDSLALLA